MHNLQQVKKLLIFYNCKLKNMIKILLSILFNAFILFALTFFLGANEAKGITDGIVVEGGLTTFLIGGVILGLINLLIRPLLQILSLPLFLVFFGLVSVIINGVVLFILDYLLNNILQIPGVSYKIV